MENYGLILFKESLVLIDSDNYSAQGRAECALTLCHEIAHQWFGNLVTMVLIFKEDKYIFVFNSFEKRHMSQKS